MNDQVSSVSPNLFTGVINPRLSPDFFHLTFQTKGDGIFAAREAIDPNELNEEIFESFFVNHTSVPR
jgi:hypothetical protein